MRILVTGGRAYPHRDRVFVALDRVHTERGITCVIHGACQDPRTKALTGADRWADEWAKERGIEVAAYPADWIRLGRYAGPVRNQQMRDEAKADAVVAFPGGKGTRDMCRRVVDPVYGPPLKIWYPEGEPST